MVDAASGSAMVQQQKLPEAFVEVRRVRLALLGKKKGGGRGKVNEWQIDY